MFERVVFTTQDNVNIVGDYYAPAGASLKGLLLLHMVPATRLSWRSFAQRMQAFGFHVLAIDLRGHGESALGPNGYQTFSDAEHQASRFDVEAGVEFLRSKGVSVITLGGASIGANLALQYASARAEVRAVFLLSPGLDYRGVTTEPEARAIRQTQALYYIASRDDPDSTSAVQKLFDETASGVEKKVTLFETAGHGTTVFDRQSGFMEEVSAWLVEVTH